MHTLTGHALEEDRQLVVNGGLRWNTGKECQKLKWKEQERKRVNYENLR